MFKGVSSGFDRFEAYKAKIRAFSGAGQQPDYTAPVVQHKLGGMYRKAQQAFSEQATYQNQVSALLGWAAVSCITRAGYQSYASEVYSLSRRYTGESLAMEVAVVVAHWVARGLAAAVLRAIRSQVFGVPEPTP